MTESVSTLDEAETPAGSVSASAEEGRPLRQQEWGVRTRDAMDACYMPTKLRLSVAKVSALGHCHIWLPMEFVPIVRLRVEVRGINETK